MLGVILSRNSYNLKIPSEVTHQELILLFNLKYFISLGVLPACMSGHHVHAELQKARGGYQIPWTGVTDGC